MMTEAEKREGDAKLFARLARAMGSLERLPKRGHNTHFGYAFVTDADVSDAVRQALAAEGIAFFANIHNAERLIVGQNKAGRDRWKTLVQCSFTFADSETGATWECSWQGEAIDDEDKGTAKAATSALKYFLLKNFILSTGDLADESDASIDEPQHNRPQQREQPGPQQAKSDPLKSQAEFFATALVAMPYYSHVNHVKNTLKLLGYTGFKASQADEMMEALQAHASEKANEEANDD